MKILVASDIHGSETAMEKIITAFTAGQCDELVLLGDIYYHGPRNPLPEGYNPQGVADMLNSVADKLTVIKGNCDADVDAYISAFDFVESAVMFVAGKKFFFSHGDKYDKDHFPKTGFDVFMYGHFHNCFITEINGKIIANPGSASLPKGGTKPAFIVIDDEKMAISLYSLDGSFIQRVDL